MTDQPGLARRLNTTDAVVIGLGSMIGAGVFSAFGPAARAAGAGLLIGLALAAAIAYCNATASAQLAAVYPVSGGTYNYGRERLGEWWGFIAGWGFVVGKTASCAAMALTVAAYAVPGAAVWAQRAVAIAAVLLLTSVNYRGVTKTAALARILLVCTLIALTAAVVGIAMGRPEPPQLSLSGGGYGILQSAGLLFFAFAGYARIATMGEEVRDPARTIPRAISLALAIAVAIYLVVAVAALAAAGPDRLAHAAAPLTEAVRAAGHPALVPVITVGAALASMGALLALIAGLGRTTLAMSRHRDLPEWLAAVHPRYHVPHRAEITLGAVVCALVAIVDLRGVIGFSSFGVLIYYAIANAAAFTLPAARGALRRRVLSACGLGGCLLLVATLPWQSAVAGLAVFAVGIAGRAMLLRRRA
ncbi:Amino acid transporter [Mycobacterium rhizamassiliense]|jgi:APA family basic amino acid/polyamine antiporter|uniref:Amino acid transporter n=1 Tax=Mycobacterium rhizamassiliense TaxID=1841860 RepID=A0A2U3NN94_9MYCO|nr:APC family permease [Mycobacterium rhizamassiliense]SPM32990.1 Amino acid transporter [Mycobacterium rhizamassiliense]